jgi:hypothetical protein
MHAVGHTALDSTQRRRSRQLRRGDRQRDRQRTSPSGHCPTAAPLFEQTFQRFPETQPGFESAWQAAGCYRTLGDFERARHHYELLLKKPGYADRAQAALASMGDTDPLELAKQKEEAAAKQPAAPAPSSKPYLGPSP